jgi:hypothetical protein
LAARLECGSVVTMLPIVELTLAWAEEAGLTYSEIASLLFNDFDLDGAIPARADEGCPRCPRHPTERRGRLFVPESARAEEVKGRRVVKCLCGTVYWYAAVHRVDAHQPLGQASVRAASAAQPVVPMPLVPSTLAVASGWSYPGAHAFYATTGMGMGSYTPLPLR